MLGVPATGFDQAQHSLVLQLFRKCLIINGRFSEVDAIPRRFKTLKLSAIQKLRTPVVHQDALGRAGTGAMDPGKY